MPPEKRNLAPIRDALAEWSLRSARNAHAEPLARLELGWRVGLGDELGGATRVRHWDPSTQVLTVSVRSPAWRDALSADLGRLLALARRIVPEVARIRFEIDPTLPVVSPAPAAEADALPPAPWTAATEGIDDPALRDAVESFRALALARAASRAVVLVCGLLGLATLCALPTAANAHLTGPHEPIATALRRAPVGVLARADADARPTSEGTETPVRFLRRLWGRDAGPVGKAAPPVLVAHSGPHAHRLRAGRTYLLPLSRSVSGRWLVQMNGETPIVVPEDDARALAGLLALVGAGTAAGGTGAPGADAPPPLRGAVVLDLLEHPSALGRRIAVEAMTQAAAGAYPVTSSDRASWVAALAKRAAASTRTLESRSEALQLLLLLDPTAAIRRLEPEAIRWRPPSLARQVVELAARAEPAVGRRVLESCAADRQVEESIRAACVRARERLALP